MFLRLLLGRALVRIPLFDLLYFFGQTIAQSPYLDSYSNSQRALPFSTRSSHSSDGTPCKYPNLLCWQASIWGVLIGLVSAISVSLWPAIIAHSLHNLSVLAQIYSNRFAREVDVLSKSLH